MEDDVSPMVHNAMLALLAALSSQLIFLVESAAFLSLSAQWENVAAVEKYLWLYGSIKSFVSLLLIGFLLIPEIQNRKRTQASQAVTGVAPAETPILRLKNLPISVLIGMGISGLFNGWTANESLIITAFVLMLIVILIAFGLSLWFYPLTLFLARYKGAASIGGVQGKIYTRYLEWLFGEDLSGDLVARLRQHYDTHPAIYLSYKVAAICCFLLCFFILCVLSALAFG